MSSNKSKISVEFKKKLRQEYERLKTLQESQEKEIIDVTWVENRFAAFKKVHGRLFHSFLFHSLF